jgi:hypothetical protein
MHAPSQITETETVRLLAAALRDPECRSTMRLARAKVIGPHDMVGHWTIASPEGPLHRVAVVRVVDAEPMGWDEVYRDESDAIAVWAHLAETYDETVTPKSR